MSQDLIVHIVAVVIADGCVGFGWLAILLVCVYLVRKWRDSVLARGMPGEEDNLGGLRWLVYAGSLLFWPAGLILGLVFLRKPATAPIGATCFYLVLAYATFSVVLAIALVTGAAIVAPEWFMG